MTAGVAGSEITCDCGAVVSVPTLRQLAQNAQQPADSSDPLVAIRQCLEYDQPPARPQLHSLPEHDRECYSVHTGRMAIGMGGSGSPLDRAVVATSTARCR